MTIESSNSLASPRPIDTRAQPTEAGGMGKDAFMKLLVAQLKNQDPLEPMDATETVTQLSQLTGVEKLQAIETRMSALEIAAAGMANTQVASLVGKNVTADADMLRLDESGDAATRFELEGEAADVTAIIRDEQGNVVRRIALGALPPGAHPLSWNGENDQGQRLAPGRYTVEYAAKNAAGAPVGVSTRISGRVTGVSYQHGYPELLVGGTRVMLGDVTSIAE